LKEQRGFADARIAADECDATEHDAAAENAIELADARGHAREIIGVYVIERDRVRGRDGFGPIADDLFGDGVPSPALGAATNPFREARAASLADVFGGDLGHAPYRSRVRNVSKIR